MRLEVGHENGGQPDKTEPSVLSGCPPLSCPVVGRKIGPRTCTLQRVFLWLCGAENPAGHIWTKKADFILQIALLYKDPGRGSQVDFSRMGGG